jgi:transposase
MTKRATEAQERRCILPAQLTDDGRCSGHCNPGFHICGWCVWGLSKRLQAEYRAAEQNRDNDRGAYLRILSKLRQASQGWLPPSERLSPEQLESHLALEAYELAERLIERRFKRRQRKRRARA